MSLKPGMSYDKLRKQERLQASMEPVQAEDVNGKTQVQPDPTKALVAETQAKVATAKQRLSQIREQLKASAKPQE